MLKKQSADDLFEKSSMSFGEHLEELRKALIKAFIFLGIGTIIGLFFADRIVKYLQTPLEQAIYNFYVKQASAEFTKANGVAPSEEMANLIYREGLMPEIVHADPLSLQSPEGAQRITKLLDAQASEVKDEPARVADATPAGDAESEKPSKESEEPVDDQQSLMEQAVEASEQARVERINAWTGVNAATFQRLKPFILFRPIDTRLISLNVTEGFMIWLKAGLVAGVVIGSPGIFWHIWQFFAAGLYPHERRYVYWYLPLSLLLFLAGVSLAFFVVMKLVLGFLMEYTTGLDVQFTPRLNDYMSFALFLPLGFGIAFQLPLVMLGLNRFGVVSAETFMKQWRMAVLAIAFLSMILTPAEIYSMIGLFVPLTCLYFLGIALCNYMPTGAGIGSPGSDPED